MRQVLLVVALGVVAGPALVSCSSGDALEVGAVESYGSGTPSGTEVSVAVPVGLLEAVVGEPTDAIGDLRAPDGGSLVRVGTRFRDGEVRDDVWDLAARAGSARSVEVSLAAGGRDYLLGVVRDGDGTDAGESLRAPTDLVVAVDGEPDELDDLTLEVGYDGLTQSVALPEGERASGPADPLYADAPDPSTLPTDACATRLDPPRAVAPSLRCEVGAVRSLPYVPELGWAEDGTAWLVVGAGLDVPTVRLDGATYDVASVDLAVEVDGQPAELVLDPADRDGRAGGQHVFSVASDAATAEVSLEGRCDLRLADGAGSAPARRELIVTAATTLDLPGARTR